MSSEKTELDGVYALTRHIEERLGKVCIRSMQERLALPFVVALTLLVSICGKQGEHPVAEQNKKQSDQQQRGGQRQQGDQDRNQQQNKSERQRKDEEAARKDEPGPDASSVGTVGT